jgi:hypothetical protein
MTEQIERSIMRLDLDSQGEFVALINAMQLQLDSGEPVERVVRLLSDAVLALADARGVQEPTLRLAERLDALVTRVAYLERKAKGR